MHTACKVRLQPNGPWHDAELTTDKPASQDGEPVVVLRNEKVPRRPEVTYGLLVPETIDSRLAIASLSRGFRIIGRVATDKATW